MLGDLCKVIFWGDSLLIEGVRASLKKDTRLEILCVHTPYPDVQELQELQPNVILFDMKSGCPDVVFSLLSTCPDLQLIAVNPESHDLMIVSAHHKLVQSITDLIDVVHKKDIQKITKKRTSIRP
jgi:hypothetical protein